MTETGPSERRIHQCNAEATRLKLLRAARSRFTVLGYDRTTTREVAADAGVNVALIKRYFGSKEGLFAAVMADSGKFLADNAEDEAMDVIDRVIAGLRPEAWPQYGYENPLLLLLRDADADGQVGALRRKTMTDGLAKISEQAGGGTDPDGRLRADLVLALLVGVTLLRKSLPDEPLATGDLSLIAREIRRATTAILAPSTDADGQERDGGPTTVV